jgi:Raf kinase inhibitor-like YbhB/YbcL family protein
MAMSLELKSSAFANGGEIPKGHTCSGADLSPALSWSGVSPAAHSLALIVDDPDAPRGTWAHWILWNIPAHLTSLPEEVPAVETLESGARQGRNDFGRIGYGGPCPPPGKPHRYFFRLFALDIAPDLQPGASRKELEHAIRGHILSQAEWIGTFRR